jgi:Flp pilus assembly protein TadG
MKPAGFRQGRRRQRGVVAIETALVLLASFALLPFMLYFARLTLHGAVLQQASFSASRYLATLPREQMRDPAQQAAALGVARSLISEAVAGAQLDTSPRVIEFVCDITECSQMGFAGAPALVTVHITLLFTDPVFFDSYTGTLLPYEYPLNLIAAQRYGN